jgi:uncharacterized membrane protein (UPF0127 family)
VAGQVTVAREDGTPLWGGGALADNPGSRLKGLLGRTGLERDEGLLLSPAPAIHTCFMRFPIDAVFLDRDLRVVGVAPRLSPWRWARRARARAVLELSAGESERRGVRLGERLSVSDGSSTPGESRLAHR